MGRRPSEKGKVRPECDTSNASRGEKEKPPLAPGKTEESAEKRKQVARVDQKGDSLWPKGKGRANRMRKKIKREGMGGIFWAGRREKDRALRASQKKKRTMSIGLPSGSKVPLVGKEEDGCRRPGTDDGPF